MPDLRDCETGNNEALTQMRTRFKDSAPNPKFRTDPERPLLPCIWFCHRHADWRCVRQQTGSRWNQLQTLQAGTRKDLQFRDMGDRERLCTRNLGDDHKKRYGVGFIVYS